MSEKTKYQIHLEETQNRLNAISPSFCVAKWKQVTMHLHNGQTHSCHHPTPHHIPIEEIKQNPTALHNTEHKKKQRKLMIEGVRPKECEYCWRVEDQGLISDRTVKSADEWALQYIDEIATTPWDDNVDPSYVEVSFSNVCNFKCSYCGPHASSQWLEELERYGGYPTSTKFNDLEWPKSQKLIPIANREENPYVDAFWEWWPRMYKSLKHFRITGGEPLLSKNTFRVLDYIIDNPNLNLDVSINSNLCPPPALMNQFVEKLDTIIKGNKVRSFKLFTSAEAAGKQAEYIRHGMDYKLWLENIDMLLAKFPNLTIIIMSTYNALSVVGYKDFLEDMLMLKRKYPASSALPIPRARIIIDIPYLRWPAHQGVFILPTEFCSYVTEQIKFMKENTEYEGGRSFGFGRFETDKLIRMQELINSNTESDEVRTNRIDFVKFVDEHDKRRGTNFLETFPEMMEFYLSIKEQL